MLKKYLLLFVVAILLIGGVTVYVRHHHTKTSASSVAGSPATTSKSSDTSKQPVTKVGTVECLSPRDKSGPQITSCAIGIKQDDGTAFALNAADPTTTGSLPTGQRVQVTGTLTKVATQYDIAGVINVTTIQRL